MIVSLPSKPVIFILFCFGLPLFSLLFVCFICYFLLPFSFIYFLCRYRESENEKVTIEQKRRELNLQASQHEEQATSIEGDLRVEREWRMSLQETMQQERERTAKLQGELSQMRIIAQVSSYFFNPDYIL